MLGYGGLSSRFGDGLQYLVNMAGYLETTPFVCDNALRVNQKGTALDAPDLFTVHVFQFHDAEQ